MVTPAAQDLSEKLCICKAKSFTRRLRKEFQEQILMLTPKSQFKASHGQGTPEQTVCQRIGKTPIVGIGHGQFRDPALQICPGVTQDVSCLGFVWFFCCFIFPFPWPFWR